MSLAGGSQTGRGVWRDPKIVESHIAPRQKHFITSVTLDRCLARSKTQTYQSCHIISYQILFYHNLSNIIMISYHADCRQIQKSFWQAPKLRLLASKVFLPGAIGSSHPKYPGDKFLFCGKYEKFFLLQNWVFGRAQPLGRGLFRGNFPIRENCSQEMDNIVHQIKYCCHTEKLSEGKISIYRVTKNALLQLWYSWRYLGF